MQENNEAIVSAVEANSFAAYTSLKDEIAAVPENELKHINIDIPAAVTTVLGSLGALRSLRPKLTALADFDAAQFDKLETYTRAAFYANMLFNVASRPPESIPELTAEATLLRDTLYSDAIALVNRDLLVFDDLRMIKTANGYRPLANDLIALAAVLRANWEKVGTKTAVTEKDLEHANHLSDRILNVVSQKEMPAPSALAGATLDRQRAYTLFFRAYDSARRAVTYLRWKEGDMETITPSLFAGRNARRKSEEEAEVPVDATDPTVPVVPVVPTTKPTAVAPTPPVIGLPSSPIPIGLPGADPFVRVQ